MQAPHPINNALNLPLPPTPVPLGLQILLGMPSLSTKAASSQPRLKTTRRGGKLLSSAPGTPLQLPEEVLYLILEYAAEYTPYSVGGIKARYEVLKSTSLVCQRWRRLSQALLLKEIVVGGGRLVERVKKVVDSSVFDRTAPFARRVSLCGLARRRKAVRWLAPPDGTPDVKGLLKKNGGPQQLVLANFESFEVADLGFMDVALPNLQSLILHDITTPPLLSPLVPALSQLDTLAISSWTTAHSLNSSTPDLRPLFSLVPPTLRKLAYHQLEDVPDPHNFDHFINLLLSSAPTLTFLSIDHVTPKLLTILPSLTSLTSLIITISTPASAASIFSSSLAGLEELGFDFQYHEPWELRVDLLRAFVRALKEEKAMVRTLKRFSVSGAHPQAPWGAWGLKDLVSEAGERGVEVVVYHPVRQTVLV